MVKLDGRTSESRNNNTLGITPRAIECWTQSSTLPICGEPPTLELKPLPDTLKYVYVGANETLPMIIAANLSEN